MDIIIDEQDEDLFALVYHDKYEGRYKKLKSNSQFKNGLYRVIATIRQISSIQELGLHRKYNFEALKHDWSGFYSVRIGYNQPWRMILKDNGDSISISIIDINYHYESN